MKARYKGFVADVNRCFRPVELRSVGIHWEAKHIHELNHLKPTGYVMHRRFNIQQLYALPTLYLCVLYLSENKQRLVPLTA